MALKGADSFIIKQAGDMMQTHENLMFFSRGFSPPETCHCDLAINLVAKSGSCLGDGTDTVMLMRMEDSSKLPSSNISL